jgi:hypothetical protein
MMWHHYQLIIVVWSPSYCSTCHLINMASLLSYHCSGIIATCSIITILSFIVASLPLPPSCGIMLLRKQYETIQGLINAVSLPSYHCSIISILLQQYCQLIINAAFVANFFDYGGILATPPTLCGIMLLEKQCETTAN